MNFIVNSFQLPNALIDSGLIAKISPNELRCYLVVVRKTVGWHKEWDIIPTVQLMSATGIKKRQTVYACMEKLEEYGLIESEKTKGKPTKYRLKVVPLDGTGTDKGSTDERYRVVPMNGTGSSTVERYTSKDNTKDTIQKTNKKSNKKKFSFMLSKKTSYENLSTSYKQKLKAACLVTDGDLGRYESFVVQLEAKGYQYKNFLSAYKAWDKEGKWKNYTPTPEPQLGDDWVRVVSGDEVFGINTKTYELKLGKKKPIPTQPITEPKKTANNPQRIAGMIENALKGAHK